MIYFIAQLYEKEAASEVNRDSPTPYNFAVVENGNNTVHIELNTPPQENTVHIELNTPPQENDVEQTAPPKLG